MVSFNFEQSSFLHGMRCCCGAMLDSDVLGVDKRLACYNIGRTRALFLADFAACAADTQEQVYSNLKPGLP